MNIAISDLLGFVTQAVDAGVQQYIKTVEPAADRIKQADAKRYLSKLGFQPALLAKWVNARLITPVKSGDTQNSAVWYSLTDIKKLIASIRLKQICNDNLPQV